MSHTPQRKEKDCLNCGTVVQGRYCHVCGQENVVPKETFWHMVTHFFNDITHFDGSFFTTAKDLLFKPGFLSKEYMKGRRVKYLHPVRMYVFTSAIFFLFFFSVFSKSNIININTDGEMNGATRLALIENAGIKYKDHPEKKAILEKMAIYKDTLKPISLTDLPLFSKASFHLSLTGKSKKFKSVQVYDSIQKSLSSDKRDSRLLKWLVRKEISINNKYSKNPDDAMKKLGNDLLHKLPYLLFVSLPLFALILRLLYIRRKQFYFADHGIFTIHFYVFNFILLLLAFTFEKLETLTGLSVFGYLIGALFIGLAIYLYKAMRFFYGQSRWKTFIKLFLVSISSLAMILFLFIIFLFFTAFNL